MNIVIRELGTVQDMSEAFELQKVVWRLHNYNDCIPEHMLLAVKQAGGIVLGAYGANMLVGFLLAIPAITKEDGLHHYSHILGVHPEWTCKDIGFSLKKAHRDIALSKGIKKIIWTYDPLLGQNARLNIGKLGAVAKNYQVDYYGEDMGGSDLTTGMPSDRFLAEWYIESKRVCEKLEFPDKFEDITDIDGLEPINSVIIADDGEPVMTDYKPENTKERILIEIPGNFQAIFDKNKEAAKTWRLKSRDMFTDCFDSGYTVAGFFQRTESDIKRNYYLLEREFIIS